MSKPVARPQWTTIGIGAAERVRAAGTRMFRARSDRAIAVGRLLLAVGSLFAIWLDPTQPRRFQSLAYGLMALYVVYALLSLVAVWHSHAPHLKGAMARHWADLAIITLVMYLTDGPTSPFFVFLAFALLSGTLYWGWRGALLTAGACVLILIGLGALDMLDRSDAGPGLHTVLTRIIYLAVSATLLIWLAAHDAQVRSGLWRLAGRAPAPPDGNGWPVEAALNYVEEVTQADRVLLLRSDGEEPWTFVAYRKHGVLQEERLPPTRFAPWVAEGAEGSSIVANDVRDGRALLHKSSGELEAWLPSLGPLLHPDLVTAYAIRSVITVPVQVDDLDARLFLLDVPNVGVDDLATAEIVAGRLRSLFQQEIFLRRLKQSAALEERVRIARDLHDGVLQSMAGTALQLRSLERLMASSPGGAKERLASIQEGLTLEQRELRAFIGGLGADASDGTPSGTEAETQLARTVDRLRRQWKITVDVDLGRGHRLLGADLVGDLCWILAEATANAVRHGSADRVNAIINVEAGRVVAEIADNGSGFPKAGAPEPRRSPRSLRERAAARGGRLSLRSTSEGACVVIDLPLAPELCR